ncbi:MAG: Gfo/Idh/MocA family oxidoreductase [Bryobacterales bacterium]|nr:Gfo/Idh/MocA family oxidoreductase [Bryobacterales bacterium]
MSFPDSDSPNPPTRRNFVAGMCLAAAPSALRASAVIGANDRIRVACVGFNGRGVVHTETYPKLPNVELVALCDIDESVLDHRLAAVERATGKRPARYVDFRKLLEDKSIDAVSIATPNHWHTLQTIWACQAGKDVYVEKPCCHNLFEARQIVAAARKYDRIVQHGTQTRSMPGIQQAALRLREGLIGEVYMARGLCFKRRDTIGRKPAEPVPPGVHYDLWQGPAQLHPFTRNRFHYNWHWFWDYGNGDIGNQGVHQMDVARWLMGVKYPARVSAMGGHFLFDDDQQTPNTLTATMEFEHPGGKPKLLVFDVRHWISNHEAGINEPKPGVETRHADLSGKLVAGPDPNTVGNIVYGSEGYMVVTGEGYRTYLGKQQEPGPSAPAGDEDHFANFIQAMRSRKAQSLSAEIEEGAISCTLVHLANISYRLRRTINWDSAKLTCTGDPEAVRMMTEEYRRPFVVPAVA